MNPRPDNTAILHLIFWEEERGLCVTAKTSGLENLKPQNREMAELAISRIVEYMKEAGKPYNEKP